ncbi:selenium-dependent xanthine dehydrogenase [Clostridium sp. D2Q-14]|uniref:selenium-dependent xanthine dehydrogenase n=1 Tax=Anaeromonas gelatinilytica TaxID=2683194 RepID=UPI00193B1EEE|nr:selenium-dependent xanthine dehydrogenase [Anaeromonas gelatinilytica]MBS4535227.1 selenium-dependent xanthine dehydrogenase [Anaeromonas gelatinilytica]
MFSFNLNGDSVSVDKDKRLLDYLRDDADLTSVKNGCNGEGVCGACTVLVDGKKMKACVLTIADVDGKNITTVEGLSDREKEVYTWSFGKAGAVQCGYCIPGMVMAAKFLLDKNSNPTEKDIKKAIIGNLCRCTGYVKIVEAIELAAKVFREDKIPQKLDTKGNIGDRMKRVDVDEKVLGTGEYVDDMKVEGMIYGSALRTKYPRALVKSIDISKAQNHPGVEAVLTAEDVPGKRYIGHLTKDWPAMIAVGEETRYLGDAVALVAAKTKKALIEALDLIVVEYEELKPMSTPRMAMAENAPKIHENGNILSKEVLKRGNADEVIAKSKYSITKKYTTPFTEHAFLEPESALALSKGDEVIIYTGCQGVYAVQKECSELLGLPPEKVRAICKLVGGGFGGKEDMSVQHHASLLAWYTKKPVKITLTRQESLVIHPKRHPMEIEVTTACDENGKLTAYKARVIADTGAYASLGGPVLQRACTHAAGPYNYQDVDIEGMAVYTNNPPAGAYRGFGVTQTIFATESNLNLLAEKVGISPWEIRYKNALKPGDILPNGQIADDSTAIEECLLAVKDEYEKHSYAGIASAIKNTGLGVGVPDFGRCRLTVIDGKVHIRVGAVCMGQGLGTVVTQMLCETVGISPELVVVDVPDTGITPDSGMSTASRQTFFTGEAVRRASLKFKDALKENSLEKLEREDFYGEYEGVTDSMGSDKENPVSHVAYSYAVHLVTLDESGKVEKVIAAHDIGKAINPKNLEGQIEGGVVMGLGYALTEDYPIKDSVPRAKFGKLGLLRANKVPEIESIIIEKNDSELAFGAKGIGEIASIPTAPAVQGAYYKYDSKFRTSLPLEDTTYNKKKK